MRIAVILLILSVLSSCKDKQSIKTELTGTWRFQSSTDDYIKNHQLIILEDSTYYMFSKTNGGGLIEKGHLSKNDSLINEQGLKYGLKKIDTNTIAIENHHHFFGDFVNSYEKRHYKPYKDELNERLQIDSIRSLALGWWKLTTSKLPIKLPNFSGEYETLIMQIKTNGSATFYLNNYLDSIVNYSYRIRKNGIDFGRGDVVGSGTSISFKSDSVMRLLMNRRSLDTLEFKKIYKLY